MFYLITLLYSFTCISAECATNFFDINPLRECYCLEMINDDACDNYFNTHRRVQETHIEPRSKIHRSEGANSISDDARDAEPCGCKLCLS